MGISAEMALAIANVYTDEAVKGGGGGGGGCHLYHGTTSNTKFKEFYIISSVDYAGTGVINDKNTLRNIIYGGVGLIIPNADSQYGSTGSLPMTFTISSPTASKITVLTYDFTVENGAVKIAKNVAEPEVSYINNLSCTKIF